MSMQAALGLLGMCWRRKDCVTYKQLHDTTRVRAGGNLGQDFAAEVSAENCYRDERFLREKKAETMRGRGDGDKAMAKQENAHECFSTGTTVNLEDFNMHRILEDTFESRFSRSSSSSSSSRGVCIAYIGRRDMVALEELDNV